MDKFVLLNGRVHNALVSAAVIANIKNPSVQHYMNKKETIYEYKEKITTCVSSIIKE